MASVFSLCIAGIFRITLAVTDQHEDEAKFWICEPTWFDADATDYRS